MDEQERRRRPIPSDRRGELLAGARDEAARRRPADLLARWSTDATVGPSPVDLRASVAYDGLALDAAEAYEGLLLSPVTPLGSTSVLAPTSQDRTLSTIRASEVVSDPTNVLALECGRRLRLDPSAHVRLCTTHQVLRMQPTGREPGRTQHFRLFVMADAGPGLADDGFEVAAVVAQLEAYRRSPTSRFAPSHWCRTTPTGSAAHEQSAPPVRRQRHRHPTAGIAVHRGATVVTAAPWSLAD